MRKKAKMFLFMVLSCLAVASSAQAGYMGLSPEAGEALVAFVLIVFALILVIKGITVLVVLIKAKIKEWVSNWKD